MLSHLQLGSSLGKTQREDTHVTLVCQRQTVDLIRGNTRGIEAEQNTEGRTCGAWGTKADTSRYKSSEFGSILEEYLMEHQVEGKSTKDSKTHGRLSASMLTNVGSSPQDGDTAFSTLNYDRPKPIELYFEHLF